MLFRFVCAWKSLLCGWFSAAARTRPTPVSVAPTSPPMFHPSKPNPVPYPKERRKWWLVHESRRLAWTVTLSFLPKNSLPSRQDVEEAGGQSWWQGPEIYLGGGRMKRRRRRLRRRLTGSPSKVPASSSIGIIWTLCAGSQAKTCPTYSKRCDHTIPYHSLCEDMILKKYF